MMSQGEFLQKSIALNGSSSQPECNAHRAETNIATDDIDYLMFKSTPSLPFPDLMLLCVFFLVALHHVFCKAGTNFSTSVYHHDIRMCFITVPYDVQRFY